jgi:hypothetical protein
MVSIIGRLDISFIKIKKPQDLKNPHRKQQLGEGTKNHYHLY